MEWLEVCQHVDNENDGMNILWIDFLWKVIYGNAMIECAIWNIAVASNENTKTQIGFIGSQRFYNKILSLKGNCYDIRCLEEGTLVDGLVGVLHSVPFQDREAIFQFAYKNMKIHSRIVFEDFIISDDSFENDHRIKYQRDLSTYLTLLRNANFQNIEYVELTDSWHVNIQNELVQLISDYRPGGEASTDQDIHIERIAFLSSMLRRLSSGAIRVFRFGLLSKSQDTTLEAPYKTPQERITSEDGSILRATTVCIRAKPSCYLKNRWEILLIRRRCYNDDQTWSLPGGGLEAGEEGSQAAHRELLEEAGVQGRPMHSLGVFQDIKKKSGTRTIIHAFVFVLQQEINVAEWKESLLRTREWFPLNIPLLSRHVKRSVDLEVIQAAVSSLDM